MTPQRSFDPSHFNAILNDPHVREDATGARDCPIDVSQAVCEPNNVLLQGEHGGCMFLRLLPGIYEVHTAALKSGRGQWIAEFVKAAGDWMFTRTDAFEIVTRIPMKHNGARTLAIHAGMKYEFTRPDACTWRGETQSIEVYSFRLQDWAANCESFDEVGAQFHDFLHKEAARIGVKEKPHGDDPNHNRYVGMALEMANHGQPGKGASVYNRWALIARHPHITLLRTDPIEIKLDIGVLRLADGRMSVEPVC